MRRCTQELHSPTGAGWGIWEEISHNAGHSVYSARDRYHGSSGERKHPGQEVS